VMLNMDKGASCLSIARRANQGEVCSKTCTCHSDPVGGHEQWATWCIA
jgi:hypothetical protein